MTRYADLVAAATVGLSQRRLDLDAVPAELGFVADPEGSPAANALEAAALFDAVRRVEGGRLPGTAEPLKAATETMAPLPDAAEATLWQIVGERRFDVVADALRLLRARGLRLSAPLIPAVLDLACERATLRPLVGPVLGARGDLLCAHNPRWEWAVEHPVDLQDENVWEHGTIGERTAWLARLRTLDPADARQRLQRAWAAEPGGHRMSLLKACATGLSMADEPWLEELLATPSIAATARELLMRLPESRLMARTERRVRACLEIKAPRLLGVGRHALLFHPERLEAGLDPKTMVTDGLARGGTLEQLNNLVALPASAAWPRLIGLDVATLARCRLTQFDEGAGLGRGLARVALRESDSVLASRFVHLFEELREHSALVALVPMPQREDLVGWALSQMQPDRVPVLLDAGGWTETIGAKVLQWLRMPAADRLRGRLLAVAGRALPIDTRIDFAAELRDLPNHTRLGPAERSATFAAAVSITLRRKLAHELADRERR